MKITKENYELFFIDYLDGNLTEQEILQLENFLLINPEYRMELEGLEKTILTPANNSFPAKDLLRKPDLTLPVSQENFDDFCAASVEGDLNENLAAGLKKYMELNPEKLNDYLIYNQIRLHPDRNIFFPLKDKLKKAVFITNNRLIYYAVSLAAAIVLVFVIMNFSEDFKSPTDNIETANLVKTDVPLTSPPDISPETEVVIPVKEISSVRRMKVTPQNQIIANVPETEIRTELTDFELNKTIAEMISNSEYFKKDFPENKLMISLLTENDVILPNALPDNQPVTVNVIPYENKYLTLSELASRELSKKVLGKKESGTSRISIMDIASTGIRGLNLLTGSRMKLEKKIKPGGESEVLAFESRLIGFSTTLSPKE